jgi:hypothetical protein
MPLRRLALVCTIATTLGPLGMPGIAEGSEPAAGAAAFPALGLGRMTRETPQKVASTNGGYNISLSLDGTLVQLVLEPSSLRRPNCQAVIEGPGGVRTSIELPASKTYRGTVRGDASGIVAATLDGDALRARIILDDGSDWYVQPLPGGVAGEHAVYRGTDVTETPGTCAAEGGAPAATRQPLAAPQAQASGCVDADIAIEAEYAYYVWNGSSSTQTISDIDAVMNAVELIYARDAKIGYRVTNYLIQTTSGKYSSSDPNTKMTQFQSWWNANQGSVTRDLAHLMTGPLNSGMLGVAYYSVLCNTSQAYGISYSTWSANWANRVGVTAHEIGHNWGATHCDGLADCALMCSHIGLCAADPTRFSMSSIHEIETYRNQSGSCLAAGSGTTTALSPTARDDRTVTLPATPVTVGVLANDFDPNCQTISIGGVTSPTSNGGVVTISGDNLLYTPAAAFLGTDTFPYTVRDAGGAQSTANATVEVQEYLPADAAAGAVAGLQVRYYYVPRLDGSLGSMPALSNPFKIETVPSLSFPTTDGVVGESGLKDKMAARCTGIINLTTAATYTFYLTASDGAKLYVDNVLRVDNDGLHGIQERSGSVSLTAGAHDVRVDYYEETGTAGLRLEIAGGGLSRADIPASMWASPGVQIAYYQLDSNLLPPLAALVPERTQSITTINYPFSWGAFAGSGRSQDVAATFEGYMTVPTDNVYFFEITSEDGSRLTIGGQLVVDNDGYHNRVAMTGGRALRAGPHKFRLDYFVRDGGCALTIQVWSSTLSKQVVPASWWSHVPTYHVPTDYATIGAAISAAPANCMVWVAAGTYTGTGNKNLDLGGKNLTLLAGGGPELTILDAQNSGRLFNFVNHGQTGAVIDGFTICHGSNTVTAGGAMAFGNSTLTVRNCFIEGNTNTGKGGALGFTGTSSPTFDGCVISGNHSDAGGGALFADAGTHPTLVGCTVSGNFTDMYGGGAYTANGGRVTFDRSILWGNSAGTDGNEAWTGDASSTVEFSCSDVRSQGVGGGGSEVFGSDIMVSDPLFCVPAPGAQAPTTGGSYRVVGSSPVLGGVTACGKQIGARGPGCTSRVTAVEDLPAGHPTVLEQNAPNPFNPVTRISFYLERGGRVTLRIFDVAGRLVTTLVDRDLPAGPHSVTWRGHDDRGRQVATGVYFYALRSSKNVLTRSMVLLK